MTELILHMNNYSIIGAITAYQTFPNSLTLYKDQFLNGKKGFWCPTVGETKS